LALHTLDTLQLSRENHQANDAPVESLLPLRHFVVPSSTINRSNETRIPVILSEQVCDKDKSKSLLFWDAAGLGSAEKQGKRQISFGAFSGHRENRHVYGRIIFSMPRTRGEPNNDAKRREIINGCRNYVGFQSPISLDFDRSEQIRPEREREREREVINFCRFGARTRGNSLIPGAHFAPARRSVSVRRYFSRRDLRFPRFFSPFISVGK